MQRKTTAVLIATAAFGALILIGFARISGANEPLSGTFPNDRANHHPKIASVRENQAVLTRLGENTVAVSYWASAPDGWHVVTTIDTVSGRDTAAEQHMIVRFSATLLPGQEQLISVPRATGSEQQALRIHRVGDNIRMTPVEEPSI